MLLLKLQQQSMKVSEVKEAVFRGLYIPDAEKKKLQQGPIKFINKVPDVKRYYISCCKRISLGNKRKWLRKAGAIMVPRVFLKVLRGKRLVAYPDAEGEYLTTEKLVNLVLDSSKYPASYYFICGIINSPVPSFHIQRVIFGNTTETSRVLDAVYLDHLILPRMNFSDREDQERHDQVVTKVKAMLKARRALANAQTDRDKALYEDKCAVLDRQIDRLVYDLYGLTEEEIAIVEGASA